MAEDDSKEGPVIPESDDYYKSDDPKPPVKTQGDK